MALLDVSEVLEDPLFTSTVILVTAAEGFDSLGNPVWLNTSEKAIQAVVTSDLKEMLRIPEELRIAGSILVRFPADLVPEGWSGTGFDEIIWNGQKYTVKDTGDYAQFGRGFLRCLSHPLDKVTYFGSDENNPTVSGWNIGRWKMEQR